MGKIVSFLFFMISGVFNTLNSLYLPDTNISIAMFILGILFIIVIIIFVKIIAKKGGA